MSVFFTADTHFGHANITRYCDRPFSTMEEMDQTMLDHWNFLVRPRDTVIHLGDFAFGSTDKIRQYLSQVSGRLILVVGNHDRRRLRVFRDLNIETWKHATLRLPTGRSIFLRHSPTEDRELWGNASLHLCGHIHQRLHPDPKIINVGVDVWNFAPVACEIVLGVALGGEVVLE